MRDILIVTDMQNDFIDGSLGTPEAVSIVPRVKEKIKSFSGTVLFTRDTHSEAYPETQEGHYLPVMHCVKGTYGWQIREELEALRTTQPIDKAAFGSKELAERLLRMQEEEPIGSITFVGLCTDICVLANTLLAKAYLPEVPIYVDAACCAGVSPASHENALNAMAVCQIQILRG